ncbi:beta-lactamase-like protein [Aspergillus crustosus]
MAHNLQIDVYVAPAIPIATNHPDESKRWFSPISCSLIHCPTSAVLVDTSPTIALSEDLAEWIKKTATGKKLRYIYTTHTHGDHFLAKCVATSTVIAEYQTIPEPLPPNGEFEIDGHRCIGVDAPHSDTEATSFLHVPSLRLVVCGDIVYGDCYQHLGEASTAEKRKKWLQSLDQIEALDPHIVIPGHKRGATRKYILAFEEELGSGKSVEELEEAMLSCKSSVRDLSVV